MGLSLNTYIQQTQRLLHDPNGEAYSTTDLTAYINEGRGQVALESESVRFLYGQQGWTVTGTTNGTTLVSAVSSTMGVVKGYFVTGSGIAPGTTVASFSINTITLSQAATGSATVTLTIQPNNQTIVNVEAYPYPPTGGGLATPLGIDSVFQVKSVTCLWGGGQTSNVNQYTLAYREFTRYQAFYRWYGPNNIGQPELWTNYNGSVLLQRIPSMVLGMQWDSCCNVTDLTGANTDVDALTRPWYDCVKYYAAYLAYLNAQRFEDSDKMFALYTKFMQRAQSFRQRTLVSNVYASLR